jgi:hypothetical protein
MTLDEFRRALEAADRQLWAALQGYPMSTPPVVTAAAGALSRALRQAGEGDPSLWQLLEEVLAALGIKPDAEPASQLPPAVQPTAVIRVITIDGERVTEDG